MARDSGRVLVVEAAGVGSSAGTLADRVILSSGRPCQRVDGLTSLIEELRGGPAVVVADHDPPRIDGFQLLAGLRRAAIAGPLLVSSRDGEPDALVLFVPGEEPIVPEGRGPSAFGALLCRAFESLRRVDTPVSSGPMGSGPHFRAASPNAMPAESLDWVKSMAHHLRDGLGTISSGLEVLGFQAPEASKGRSGAVELMRWQCRQMASTLDGALDVMGLMETPVGADPGEILLEELFADVLRPCRRDLEARGIRPVMDLPGTPAWIEADLARLKSGLGRVLEFAIGRLRPSESLAVVGDLEGGAARLGIGPIGVGTVPREGESSPRGSGGFDLVMTARVLECWGGQLSCGAEGVWVRLPVRTASNGQNSGAASGGHVLLLDAESAASRALEELLFRAGFRTRLCTTMAELLWSIEARGATAVVVNLDSFGEGPESWNPGLLRPGLRIIGMGASPSPIGAAGACHAFLPTPVRLEDVSRALAS